MLDVFNTASPQSANYQEFYAGTTTSEYFTWVKPRGASMVRMLLIGGGAGGRPGTTSAGGAGGGSGAVTTWIGPALFVPDSLLIQVGAGSPSNTSGASSLIQYFSQVGGLYTLLRATGGTASGGTAATNTTFGASGIFRSVAGQNGAAAATAISASGTTFLSGGAGGSGTTTVAGAVVNANYGYPAVAGGTTSGGVGGAGYFMTQPFMQGTGGGGGGGNSAGTGGVGGKGSIGCGGGGGGRGSTAGGAGGNGGGGAVFIWAW